MSYTDRSAGTRTAQLKCRPCCLPRPIPPPPVDWSQYPPTKDVSIGCNRLVDVSSISFCDGTYIGSGSSFDISSSQVLVLSGTADPSGDYNGASVVSGDRIYQELHPDLSWNSLNGYYALAKDSAPALSEASAIKATSSWRLINTSTVSSTSQRSVCWSPERGLFVSVSFGGANTVLRSTDGVTWLASSSAAIAGWFSIVWAKNCPDPSGGVGLFCAIANGSASVMTSPDGITWTLRSTGLAGSWYDLCWSSELQLFCAVGTTGVIITSPDAITWTQATLPTPLGSTFNVAWSPELGIFCVLGSSAILISADGITWTTGINPVGAYAGAASLTWSPQLGLFCAVGFGIVITSPDGVNWTFRTAAANLSWFDVCWSADLGIFCAINNNTIAGTNRVQISWDGINWLLQPSGGDFLWRSIVWSPELGMFCAVTNSSGGRVMISNLSSRPPTPYNVFDSQFNRIDQSGNWTIQQVLKAGAYTAGQTTPSVAGTNLLYITNSVATIITNFTGGTINQRLVLVFNDGNTTLSGVNIRLSAAFTGTQFDTLTLLFTGIDWVEISRSINA